MITAITSVPYFPPCIFSIRRRRYGDVMGNVNAFGAVGQAVDGN
jgi:hypothetical protein